MSASEPEAGGEVPDAASRIRGCLLGGAIGDALGAPTEFLTLAEIRPKYGPRGVTGFESCYGRPGAFTDDTQMTLFTAEGLIRASNRAAGRGRCNPKAVLFRAYRRWYSVQGAPPVEYESEFAADEPSGWLLLEPALRHRRAPGHTCLSALQSADTEGGPADNDSKGCGGVMRIAPVGLVARDPFRFGCEVAAITHGHPTGSLAAGTFAEIIAHVMKGEELEGAIAEARARLRMEPDHEETLGALDAAVALAGEGGAPSAERLESLGEGWVAEEALGLALYCALTAADFRSGVLLAANHSGDSDSTGALTGNLLGTLWGEACLPEEWVEGVEGREAIERIADDIVGRFLEGEKPHYEAYPPW